MARASEKCRLNTSTTPSVHKRTVHDIPRTNNALEGWHNGFKKRMVITHPTESKLINKVRSEQVSTEMVIEQIFQGNDVRRKTKKYTEINKRLKNIVEGYEKENVLDFLKAIAYNL